MIRYCEAYLQFLSLEKNASPNTIASYRLDVARYLRFLEGRNIRNLDDVTEQLASEFLRSLHDSGLSPRSPAPCRKRIIGHFSLLF